MKYCIIVGSTCITGITAVSTALEYNGPQGLWAQALSSIVKRSEINIYNDFVLLPRATTRSQTRERRGSWLLWCRNCSNFVTSQRRLRTIISRKLATNLAWSLNGIRCRKRLAQLWLHFWARDMSSEQLLRDQAEASVNRSIHLNSATVPGCMNSLLCFYSMQKERMQTAYLIF